jgi:Predicted permeases
MDPSSLFGIDGLTWTVLGLIVLAAFAAGWVDAVIGGGGLVQLPVLLLVPGFSPITALATNKFASIFGTSTSALTYRRHTRTELRSILPMAAMALLGSAGGAALAAQLPVGVIKPIIVVALIGVAAFTAVKPELGRAGAVRPTQTHPLVLAVVVGTLIGAYDGMIGPGTGAFLVFSLVGLLGLDFLQASAKAKVVNVATNLGALAYFIPHGWVSWRLGLALALANLAGGYLGARTAISRGAGFVRAAFLVVSAVLIAKLCWDTWGAALVG